MSAHPSENSQSQDALQNGVHQSVFMSAMQTKPIKDFPLCWEQHSKLLPGVDKVRGSEVAKWSIDQVAQFVKTLPGCEDYSKTFKEEVCISYFILYISVEDSTFYGFDMLVGWL